MTYVSTCITDGAVGLWELADASVVDSATAVDQTAVSNGAYASNGWTGGQTGLPGMLSANAAKVTAAGGWVAIPDVAGNQTADTFTYELWIKMAALPGALSGLMGAATTLFQIATDGTFYLTKQATGDLAYSTSTIAADNAWHYVVCAKNGAVSLKYYLDSVNVTGAVSNLTMDSSAGSGYVLAKNAAHDSPAATFAMFAVYPTPLSAGTVLTHYQIGSNTVPATTTTVPGPPPLLGRMGR